MRCGGCITGVLLAVGVFLVLTFGANAVSPWRNALEDLACNDNETFTRFTTYYGEEQVDYECTDARGISRNITDDVTTLALGVSVAAFVAWTLLIKLSYILVPSRESEETWETIQVIPVTNAGVSQRGDTLATRLQQLQEALNLGLISQDEYDHNRLSLLGGNHVNV